MGPEAKELIDQVKKLQDVLGDLNDAVVACNLLRDFLTWGTWGPTKDRPDEPDLVVAPGVTAYLATRQIELQDLVKRFPAVWEQIRSPEFSRLATQAVAHL